MDFTEPLTEAIRDDGKAATYTRAGHPAAAIEVLFVREFVAVEGLGEAGVGSSSLMAHCLTADVPSAARGDTLAVDGTTYYVHEARADGAGVTVLILSEDPI
jgi:hypothetical protein